ncbi:L-histidine N(alpha)-methyltransferase [Gramella sp. AN32]|uniref:L-histidine N(Alpha)-methyltransferase n=1 Tax=Christiangramia antarctica TaxID=2058158 RepID=A0ABW5X2Y4_9FLAO|nr:L-histidine N(alpha)-methyltransferase [Gramella sp. AN32]MCM4157960.1 L-histidine N(alpha)-methyltransferase [Gramella sp. AN32]
MNNEIKEVEPLAQPISVFESDVTEGLTASPKFLKSKYFYDKTGDKLFQQIMELREYYLTNCELEILNSHKEHIAAYFKGSQEPFQLVDLGAGNAYKTKILLQHFIKKNVNFEYVPVDISENAIEKLTFDLKKHFPKIQISGYSKEYLDALRLIKNETPKLILFLGASIGNFSRTEAEDFFKQISRQMNAEDLLCIGFDLKKDTQIILDAYNDARGITKKFNLNLLTKINREFNADFKTDTFEHVPSYDPHSGEARSALRSKFNQKIAIQKLGVVIELKEGELIHTEISKKYALSEIKSLAENSGFQIVENLFDKHHYFTNSVWRKN